MAIFKRASLIVLTAVHIGCATPGNTAHTQPVIYSFAVGNMLLYGSGATVDAIDGKLVDRSNGYVEIDPGEHVVTVGYVSCILPLLIFTCAFDIGSQEFNVKIEEGQIYKVIRSGRFGIENIETGELVSKIK